MDVFQCPDCELKFRYASELMQHIEVDHPEFRIDPKSVEDALISASHRHRHKRSYQAGAESNAG